MYSQSNVQIRQMYRVCQMYRVIQINSLSNEQSQFKGTDSVICAKLFKCIVSHMYSQSNVLMMYSQIYSVISMYNVSQMYSLEYVQNKFNVQCKSHIHC